MAINDFEGDIWKPAFAIRCFITGGDKSPAEDREVQTILMITMKEQSL